MVISSLLLYLALTLPLGEEEYYELATIPIPDDIVLEVSGIEVLEDGPALVATRAAPRRRWWRRCSIVGPRCGPAGWRGAHGRPRDQDHELCELASLHLPLPPLCGLLLRQGFLPAEPDRDVHCKYARMQPRTAAAAAS